MSSQKKSILGLLLLAAVVFASFQNFTNPSLFRLAKRSDPARVSHEIVGLKGAVLGISEDGGGYINYLYIKSLNKNVVGPLSARYGRGGQSSIRDGGHGGAYNPTQAGFTDHVGTVTPVIYNNNQIILPKRIAVNFCADRKFDYVENNDIDSASCNQPGDLDQKKESAIKEADEITTDITYQGSYESCASSDPSVNIDCFRHRFEYDYSSAPGYAISQFYSLFSLSNLDPQTVSLLQPTRDDLSDVEAAYSFRVDNALWLPPYRFVWNLRTNAWETTIKERLGDTRALKTYHVGSTKDLNKTTKPVYAPLLIIGDNSAPNQGVALGIYRPYIFTNSSPNILRTANKEVSLENRDYALLMMDNTTRLAGAEEDDMQLMGFKAINRGILNPKRLAAGAEEGYRNVYYILIGTPKQILDNAQKIQPF